MKTAVVRNIQLLLTVFILFHGLNAAAIEYCKDCLEIFERGEGSIDGNYIIDPDGPGGQDPISVECLMSLSGGGWTKLDQNVADSLINTEVSNREYLYVKNGEWYRTPSSQLIWSWNIPQVLIGTYYYSGGGSFYCGSSNEKTRYYGIGCSNGPGGKWKALIYYPTGKDPVNAQLQLCQDQPGIFGSACQTGVVVYIRQDDPEKIIRNAIYKFEEGDTPSGSVDLGEAVTLTFAGDIEVGVIDNHPGFYLGSRPVPSLMAAVAAPGEAANLSFTFEEPIQAFTVLAADYDGNTTISAYDGSGQVVENVAVTGATLATYALTWEQPIAKIVISGTSGWVGTTEALAVILGQILSQLDGGAVQGVTITITPSGRQATSDRNGNYTLTGIKPGTYSLTGTGQNIATVTVSGLTVSAGSTVTQDLLATVAQGAGSDPTAGWNVTADLWAKAVLEVSGGPVALVWQEVGADMTPSGDQVISGYFYADPADFAYGSPYNPELFVKIYIAANGWCNMAFNHVTVDPVTVFSAHQYGGTADQTGSATLENRLLQHEFTGVAIDPGKQSAGGQSGTASSAGYPLGSALWSQAVLQVPGNPVTLVWKEVGTDTTPSGARVVSGYFYADPADFAYGSVYNPEVFVKVYIDPTGWANMAFNHVTVDPVAIGSAFHYAGTADKSGSVILDSRLLEHSYTGVAIQ